MIRAKLLPFVFAAGFMLAANPAVQAQEGEKQEKKEYKEREKEAKEREKDLKERKKDNKKNQKDKDRYEEDDRYENREGQVGRRPKGRIGDILGKVILPPAGTASPRQLQGVPKGHYPPPGKCRVWYPDRPAGHQPPPTDCQGLVGARLEPGAFILHGDKAYDAEYDWREEERRRPGSVGRDILDILFPKR